MRFFPRRRSLRTQVVDKVRIDKWLWAARFFKTRSLAKAAIDGGKVKIEGQRTRPSREVGIGCQLDIRQGWDEKTVEITALSDQRRGASEAGLLYTETQESLTRRALRAEQRKLAQHSAATRNQKPTKKERRQIQQHREKEFYE